MLYLKTASGYIWESRDEGVTWLPFRSVSGSVTKTPFTQPVEPVLNVQLPGGEEVTRVMEHPFRRSEYFALGFNLYRSVDRGATWTNLTGDAMGSTIGPWQMALAISPTRPDTVIVGNAFGLWKSADNGLTWNGLNHNLPNFPAGKLIYPPSSKRFIGFYAEKFGVVETRGSLDSHWRKPTTKTPAYLSLKELNKRYEKDAFRVSPYPLDTPSGFSLSYRVLIDGIPVTEDLTACGVSKCVNPEMHYISAFSGGMGKKYSYLGTSDGFVWVSQDHGLSWSKSYGRSMTDSPVISLFAYPMQSEIAVLILGHKSRKRVLYTVDGGAYWNDLTGDLPKGRLSALVVDLSTDALYVSGDSGVFYVVSNLTEPLVEVKWKPLGVLPASVKDILLDEVTDRLYAVVDGYGVFTAKTPVIPDGFRILNAADFTRRETAPGGLLTVFGKTPERITIDGRVAPLLFSDGMETQVQVPYNVSGKAISLTLSTKQENLKILYPLRETSPAIFVDRGNPLVLDAVTSQSIEARHPAIAGSRILVLATGLGAVKPAWPTGVAGPSDFSPAVVKTVKAYLGDVLLDVKSAVLASGYIGMYVVEIEIPLLVKTGVEKLSLEIDGVRSNRVQIHTRY